MANASRFSSLRNITCTDARMSVFPLFSQPKKNDKSKKEIDSGESKEPMQSVRYRVRVKGLGSHCGKPNRRFPALSIGLFISLVEELESN